MALYIANQRGQRIRHVISFSLLWLLGLTGIGKATKGLKLKIMERDKAEAELKKAHDELELRVEERNAELTKMNANLNREIIERKRAEEALRKAHGELEQRVEERTAELAKVNEQLLIEIEERKQLEAQILHAQKMDAVGTLAGGIAHDFNNILQSVSGYTEILLMEKERSDPDYAKIKIIERSVKRAGNLVKQLLTFSRRVESKLRPVDLNQEVMQIYELLKRTIPKMVRIECHLSEDLNIINADPIQLEQVMMNLGLNAKDVMADGGRLIFETENITLDEQYCRMHPGAGPGDDVLLSVSDTGHGMDKEIVDHIFEPFYTTKETGMGTGLGLAMVYGIVKSHGGYIMCYSEPDQGTTFKIYFPVIKGESIEQGAERKEGKICGGNETVLLVDDEEHIREVGKNILEQFGYTTIMAESGEKAIEIFEREREHIDLVILDVSMPGMGGHKCLNQLLKIDPKLKIVISSGYSASGKVRKTIESGAAGFIGKPYRLTDMLKKVREVLDKDF